MGVDETAVVTYLKMQMRSGGIASAASITDGLSL
jgi:hypothetical protein